jgi:probable F420-dependent oxidoreductase
MRLGLIHLNMGSMSSPAALAEAARLAEEAGFDSLWAGEHIVLPDPRVPPSPMEPQDPALDSLLALTWAAAHTSTIRLATGIVILPQRNPLVLAKQVATLDVLSGGRMILGVGAGYLAAEFAALGANFPERNAVTDEYLEALEALWYAQHPEYHGRFVDFSGVDAHPRPRQARIPIVMGGHRPPSFRRAVARADGWYGYALKPQQMGEVRDELRAAAERVDRPPALGPLEISVTPRGRPTAEQFEAFARAGVHRLVILAPPTSDGPQRAIEAALAAAAGL